ncbi:MAG: alpha/beta hydrolase [Pirellulaceae bacterium]|jgi:acetyl esterase/lipase|nr:alpha/beta hydrolase [Pirellulaceae bacterium]MDP7020664.1 alpha/beta hydrolase [Pirellulaceae bacterium]
MSKLFRFACIASLVISTTATAADNADKPVIKLWPHGLPQDAKPIPAARVASLEARQTVERITYVAEPTVTVYRAPAAKANGCGVVICPGGGYNILAWPKEGLEVAEWFNSIGVTAVVLKYRVPRRDPARPHWEPLQDAQRAIRIFRGNADAWNVDPNRIGILGFSAGGHLAFMAGTHFAEKTYDPVDDADERSARPDFLCPIYAAYLGNDYKDNRAEIGSLVRITKQTPPTFMAVTLDDTFRGVQAGMILAKFKGAGVPAEAHIYANGGHGYGIRPSDNPVSKWHLRLGEWMTARKLTAKPAQ